MGQILRTFQAQPQFTETVTLGSTQFQLTFTYRARLSAWYVDFFTLDGSAVVTGRRLSPGFDALFGGLPALVVAGHFFVRGSDPYTREMLGDRVVPVFYPFAEVPAPPASATLSIVLGP
jgi:hypothetical protein